jgi:hypothetical protein
VCCQRGSRACSREETGIFKGSLKARVLIGWLMCCASGSWQRRHAHARAASVPRRAGRRTAEERSEGESKVEREHCGEDLALRRQALLPDQVRNHVCMVCGNVSVRCQGVLCNVDVAGSQGSDHVWRGSFRARLSRLKRWSLLPGHEGPPHHRLLPPHASHPDHRARATLSLTPHQDPFRGTEM